MASPQPPAQLRTLLGIKEPERPGRIVVWDTEEISLGRAPENDVVVDDSDASRKHALFQRAVEGYQVQDLGTANGTLVNGTPLSEEHRLSNKDVVKVGEIQITFIQTRKDPGTLGLEVVFASQLKGFAGAAPAADPGATTLGLADLAPDGFEVGAVGDFGYAGNGDAVAGAGSSAPPATRDLDLEFNEPIPGEGKPLPTTAGAFSLHLELDGLTPDLRRMLEALIGKVIELPALKVRIKG
jgi:predicted component of type VI protein secretion system